MECIHYTCVETIHTKTTFVIAHVSPLKLSNDPKKPLAVAVKKNF